MRVASNQNMIGDQSGYTFTPAPLKRSQYNSSLIGKISLDAPLRTHVRETMNPEPKFLE